MKKPISVALAAFMIFAACSNPSQQIAAPLVPAATPTFSPAGGTYAANQSVTISCTTANASIYYTTDGTTPTTGSTSYTGAISAKVSPVTAIQAIATAPESLASAIANATYFASSIDLVSIPSGSFNNGTSTVTISAFLMATYDVTQSLYQSVTGTNPSYFSLSSDAASCPVEGVTWYDAVEFCNKLSEKDGLTPVYTISDRDPSSDYPIVGATVSADFSRNGYRLPTEAQWEYAARAKTTTAYYWGNASDDATVGQYAWYTNNSSVMTHAVGQKLPNDFGLYDMAGNVGQLCWDWYDSYPSGAQTDPTGASSGKYRVVRGGSCIDASYRLTSAYRGKSSPDNTGSTIGFRVCAP